MRMRFFNVPVEDSGSAQAELNRFLASHRVLSVERQLLVEGIQGTWAICISYVDGPATGTASASGSTTMSTKSAKRSIDYRELLSADEFRAYSRIRALRKQLSDKDGVPAYALFTNEQLADMVRGRVKTANDLGRIHGIGKARVEKYGPAFLAALSESIEPAGEADAT